MTQTQKWFFIAVFSAVVVVSVARVKNDDMVEKVPTPVAETAADRKNLIENLLAQQCVAVARKSLHDPASAELPNAASAKDYSTKFFVGEVKKGLLSVQFEMRARNGFNALRAYNVQCDFKDTGSEYKFVKYDSWQIK